MTDEQEPVAFRCRSCGAEWTTTYPASATVDSPRGRSGIVPRRDPSDTTGPAVRCPECGLRSTVDVIPEQPDADPTDE